ncbi:monovalent cation:proton antiporter-2 (CPA2) family protein [Kushneria marisflavi]|uniref:Potassium transporter n=1 Tax=Kushneria marisflavi TaxID=157779 RepID=A0A240UJH5_9GAMM|nr:monovalent cation:proton antiporter-2 (CPA2) family protein [Kushneria marisflavi]ART61641.1 potassium transporter [Kushneria marisflavi]RKD86651.1 Kef-type potassium/proton antiporter (CPA2 family) [Kushneria marisflavi]
MHFLLEATVMLGAAVVAVPLFARFGLGSILGYLCAGLILGPSISGFIADPESVLHFSEIGVVMLLFVIGLELEPARLWRLRGRLFGLGSLQLFLTGLLLTPLGWMLGLGQAASILLGLTLALSSTAFALQLLTEHQHLASPHGQTAFAILLFQDLAVIPLLAVIPILAGNAAAEDANLWLTIAKTTAIVVATLLVGRFVFPRVLRLVARSEVHEVFTAAALLMVLGTAWVMEEAGLSMALGAFLAGVLLADTPYRHELEANIEPFKGILLGLFFLSVGMSVDLLLVMHNLLAVLGITLAILVVKILVLCVVGVIARLPRQNIPRLAAVIAQGGEFDFVLLTTAVAAGVFEQKIASLCIAAVTISMACTPFLYTLGSRIGNRFKPSTSWDNQFPDDDPPVIIAGLGRFGQMVARVLKMQNVRFTALDPNIRQVEFIRQFGSRIYYADATRLELLRSAGIDRARMLIICVDDEQAALTIARLARENYPDLSIHARARNRHHAWRLQELGVDVVVRETFSASLELSQEVLVGLGYPSASASQAVRTFRDFDVRLFEESYQYRNDNAQLLESDRAAIEEFYKLFQSEDREDRHHRDPPQQREADDGSNQS